MAQQRIDVFKDLAHQVASQIVDRLCHEFEKQIAQVCIHEEIDCRKLSCSDEPPGGLLSRQDRLDMMMSTMAEHHSNIAKFVHSAEHELARIVNSLHQLDLSVCQQQPINVGQAKDSSWTQSLSPRSTPRNHSDDDDGDESRLKFSPIAQVVRLKKTVVADSPSPSAAASDREAVPKQQFEKTFEHADISAICLRLPSPARSMRDRRKSPEHFPSSAKARPPLAVGSVRAQQSADFHVEREHFSMTRYTQEQDETSMRVDKLWQSLEQSNASELYMLMARKEVEV